MEARAQIRQRNETCGGAQDMWIAQGRFGVINDWER